MTDEFSKGERKHFRTLLALAHERELGAALRELRQKFDEWESGSLNAFQLNDEIHAFHQGISRDLYKAYDPRNAPFPVAYAVASGILSEEEVGEQHLNRIRSMVDHIRARAGQ